jgi:predicted ArsR family transcriptional regulator
MTNQPTLFDQARLPQYPFAPAPGVTDTSREAAEAIAETAPALEELVLKILQREPHTADECAALLGESVLAIRPRLSTLRKRGEIEDTGERRKNRSGRNAAVWKAKERHESNIN